MDDLLQAGKNRNHVVHNPLMVDVYTDGAGKFDLKMGLEQLRDAGAPLIQLNEVDQLTARVRGLYVRFMKLQAQTFYILGHDSLDAPPSTQPVSS
jgi:hypothetical protein